MMPTTHFPVPESGTIAFITDNGAGTTYGKPYTKGTYKVRVPEGEYLVRITGKRRILLDTPIPGALGGPPITHRDEKLFLIFMVCIQTCKLR